MTWLNHESLGFASNPVEAFKIIKETGIFYMVVSVAYLLSFLSLYRHSASVQKRKKAHIICILMWGFIGEFLILQPGHFSTFFSFFAFGVSAIILYQLHCTNRLAAKASITTSKDGSDDKKKMYAESLLKRRDYTLVDLVSFSLVNEQILWWVILYRSAIALRASMGI